MCGGKLTRHHPEHKTVIVKHGGGGFMLWGLFSITGIRQLLRHDGQIYEPNNGAITKKNLIEGSGVLRLG